MRLPAGAHEALVNDPNFLRQLVEAALNRFLDAEISEHLQAGPYERSDARTGYRNGYRARQLKTRVGTISLAVPMDREGSFRAELFDRYQRSEKASVRRTAGRHPDGDGGLKADLEGASTRKVRDVTEALYGTSFSKSTVSRLVGSLDADLAAWRERRLEVAYPYLIVDAGYEHVCVNGQVVSQGVLVVKGVREDGLRELLAVEVADTENEVPYEDLFRRLKDRGLHGVQLVTSDDHRGLVNAIRKHFQGVSWQRCQVRVARNALGKVGRKYQRAISADVRAVFNAPSLDWARELMAGVARKHDPQLAALYRRLMVERGRHHNQALCAVATHLADRIYALLRENRTYQPRDLDGRAITNADATRLATNLAVDAATRARLRVRRREGGSREPQSGQPKAPQGTARPSIASLADQALDHAQGS